MGGEVKNISLDCAILTNAISKDCHVTGDLSTNL